MTECCGVVRTAAGLGQGLERLDRLERRLDELEVRPDLAGFADLAHAFDLGGSVLAARATLESALERRETRGAHNRADFPDLEPSFRVNLVWSRSGITRATTEAPSPGVAALAGEPAPEVAGRLLE